MRESVFPECRNSVKARASKLVCGGGAVTAAYGLRAAQKGKPIPAGMINALLRIDPKATVCSVESFLA